jgi:hypothetical protein
MDHQGLIKEVFALIGFKKGYASTTQADLRPGPGSHPATKRKRHRRKESKI